MSYAILLTEHQKIDMERAARVIAKARDIIYGDATRVIKEEFGILVRNLPRDEADSIAAELNSIGASVFVMNMEEFYHPPSERLVSVGECLPECFMERDLYGREKPILWDNITLLNVGRITETHRERFTTGGQPEGGALGKLVSRASRMTFGGAIRHYVRHKAEEKPAPQTEIKQFLDIFTREPQEGHIRIEATRFNYGYLGERVRQSSHENFKLFVEDVCNYARRAFAGRGLHALLGREAETNMDFPSLNSFDDENLWMLQLIYLSKKRGG